MQAWNVQARWLSAVVFWLCLNAGFCLRQQRHEALATRAASTVGFRHCWFIDVSLVYLGPWDSFWERRKSYADTASVSCSSDSNPSKSKTEPSTRKNQHLLKNIFYFLLRIRTSSLWRHNVLLTSNSRVNFRYLLSRKYILEATARARESLVIVNFTFFCLNSHNWT